VDSNAIGSALDAGAAGVQVPNINTADQAKSAVQAARFHPGGSRGVCRFVRAAKFGSMPRAEYFKEANRQLLVLQVEGLEGVKNLDAILDVPGFDVLFVGPYDLSQSVGKPGEINAPEVRELVGVIAAKAKKKGILLGSFCDTPENARFLAGNGFAYIAYSVDVNIFLDGCARLKDFIA
jgi:4-hydroxy-2-oxoheptanedioate aldolase